MKVLKYNIKNKNKLGGGETVNDYRNKDRERKIEEEIYRNNK